MSDAAVKKTWRIPPKLAEAVSAKCLETQQSENEWVVLALEGAVAGGEVLLPEPLRSEAEERAAERGMVLADWLPKVVRWALDTAKNPAKRITTREALPRPDPDADSPVVWERYFAELKGLDWEVLTPIERADLKDFRAGRNPARRRNQSEC